MLFGILTTIIVAAVAATVVVVAVYGDDLFNPTDPDNVFFQVSTRGKCDRELSVKNLEAVEFDPNLPTYFLIHGYPFGSKRNIAHFEDLRTSLLRREDCNVIIVNYLKLSNWNYFIKAKKMPRVVGNKIASLLNALQEKKGLDLNTTNLIGFSIGAHIAGVVGKKVEGIGMIQALDPAGFMFEKYTSEESRRRLSHPDAKRVVVHSTNGRGIIRFGHSGRLGHVKIFYNGGKSQPGCGKLDDACHHKRSVAYFDSSICGPDVLLYRSQLEANNFRCEDGVPFSQVSGQLYGIFHVTTTGKYPYFRTEAPYHSVGCRYGAPPTSFQAETRTKCLPPNSVCVPSKTN